MRRLSRRCLTAMLSTVAEDDGGGDDLLSASNQQAPARVRGPSSCRGLELTSSSAMSAGFLPPLPGGACHRARGYEEGRRRGSSRLPGPNVVPVRNICILPIQASHSRLEKPPLFARHVISNDGGQSRTDRTPWTIKTNLCRRTGNPPRLTLSSKMPGARPVNSKRPPASADRSTAPPGRSPGVWP